MRLPEHLKGCQLFDRAPDRGLESRAETVHRRGGLGISWQQTRVIP